MLVPAWRSSVAVTVIVAVTGDGVTDRHRSWHRPLADVSRPSGDPVDASQGEDNRLN